MSIYVIQWIFIGLATPIFDKITDVFVCLGMGAIVLVLTLVSAWLWDKLMTKIKSGEKKETVKQK